MGQETPDQTWDTVLGAISVDSITLPAGITHSHEINWLGLTDQYSNCNNKGACWIQAGYGEGDVGGHVNSSGLRQYMEENDVNGYTVNWIGGLTQNTYVQVYDTGQMSGAYTLYDAYVNNTGQAPLLVGQAYLKTQDLMAGALSEALNVTTAACPTLARYEYFGTNGSGGGGNTTTYGLQIGNNTGSQMLWNIANAQLSTNNPPYTYTAIYSRAAFEGSGG